MGPNLHRPPLTRQPSQTHSRRKNQQRSSRPANLSHQRVTQPRSRLKLLQRRRNHHQKLQQLVRLRRLMASQHKDQTTKKFRLSLMRLLKSRRMLKTLNQPSKSRRMLIQILPMSKPSKPSKRLMEAKRKTKSL
jgi:hypothetical protein